MKKVSLKASGGSRLWGLMAGRPMVPAKTRVIAVGDIHGRADLLTELLTSLKGVAASVDDVIVFVGDYIDRGPDSRSVIEKLVNLDFPGRKVFLRGNHDQTLLDFIERPDVYREWRNYGAPETLISYGVRPPRFENEREFAACRDAFLENCPSAHLRFFQDLGLMHQEGDYLFVHAGLRPGIPVHQQRKEDLLWIRDDFLFSDKLSEVIVVHGHTPNESPVLRSNRLGIDTGAYATGSLTAAIFEEDRIDFISTGRSGININDW